MQPIPLILLTLAALGTLLLLLRHRWFSLTPRSHRLTLAAAILPILAFLFSYATHWTTSSPRVDAAFLWAAIAGYLLLLTIHSLTRPRWLTIGTAVILATLVLTSSVLLPLGGLFFPRSRRIDLLGDHMYAAWMDFTDPGAAGSGTDIVVFYKPSLLPFVEHAHLAVRFYNARCNSGATDVVLQPDGRTVYIRCPPWPGSGAKNNGEFLPLQ